MQFTIKSIIINNSIVLYRSWFLRGRAAAPDFDKKALLSQRWPHDAPYIYL